jgi:hypothetical protein
LGTAARFAFVIIVFTPRRTANARRLDRAVI